MQTTTKIAAGGGAIVAALLLCWKYCPCFKATVAEPPSYSDYLPLEYATPPSSVVSAGQGVPTRTAPAFRPTRGTLAFQPLSSQAMVIPE